MTDMWNPEKIFFLLGGGGCNGIQWMQGHLTLCFFLIIKNIYYILTVYHCIFLYVHVMVIFFDDEKICNVRCLWLLLTFSLWVNNTQHIYLILKYFVGCIKWIKTIYYNTYHSLSPLPCSNYLFTFKSTSTCCNMIFET